LTEVAKMDGHGRLKVEKKYSKVLQQLVYTTWRRENRNAQFQKSKWGLRDGAASQAKAG